MGLAKIIKNFEYMIMSNVAVIKSWHVCTQGQWQGKGGESVYGQKKELVFSAANGDKLQHTRWEAESSHIIRQRP